MERKLFAVLIISIAILSLSSCKASKQYVQYISKKENINTPETKKVLVFATEDVEVKEFKKTFDKNFKGKRFFTNELMLDFSNKITLNNLFSDVLIDSTSTAYESLNKEKADYVIYFSNIEITNRVEWRNSGGMGMNGMGGMQTTSVEYCVINLKVEVYDAKNDKEILDFVAIGEDSVFLFNFTKTFNTAKERALDHIINYLKSGKTEYKKY